MKNVCKYDLNNDFNMITVEILKNKTAFRLSSFMISEDDLSCTLTISHEYHCVYGLGERFDQVNQKGRTVTAEVTEKFCNQGNISYCPIPFFFTNNNFGLFIDTFTVTNYSFYNEMIIRINKDSKGQLPIIYFFYGSPAEILMNYSKITGNPVMVPKWSFGPWMSANRWHSEEEVITQLENMKKYKMPYTVMVVEAWSDEATFYRFQEDGKWEDPEGLIRLLQENGVHLILWQIPVIKKMDHNERHEILDQDWAYAVENNLCIRNLDGTPYTIPENHWFAGSLLPDFTNEETVRWWFDKRQYLLSMGVDGFKTDGGEFVLRDDCYAKDGSTGLELRNQYAADYVEAYSNFVGKDRILFSRAGYMGQQKFPIQWAGDQMSTWEEFKHILTAGLSIGLSGVPFWGFDIAGFAGPMPGLNLYERATQLAVFAPVMQWHSEPVGGQYADILAVKPGVNDRSPWNVSILYEDAKVLERLGFHYNLRMNLLPYLYNLALHSSVTGLPMMKHLILEYPDDRNVYDTEDCYMLGDLLIAPILEEGKTMRNIYLPEGNWTGLWPMKAVNADALKANNRTGANGSETDTSLKLKGKESYLIDSGQDRIPVFIRDGGCLALNLDQTLELGSDVGNKTGDYHILCFYIAGPDGTYHFKDDENNEIIIEWENGSCQIGRISGNAIVKVIQT